jgi:hypothetical protein
LGMSLRTVRAVRYIQPLREGGSLPLLAETDDGKKFVVKMRGAGQGALALTAEIIGGEMARALGLRVPEIVLVELDAAFGRNEPDAEIQDLFKRSTGLNVGLEFLPGATVFDPAAGDVADANEASRTVWLDAFLLNIDRTAKNANLLMFERRMWLIDQGAALYFHHNWPTAMAKAALPFVPIRGHILLRWASEMSAAGAAARAVLTEARAREIVGLVPGLLLHAEGDEASDDERRAVYLEFFLTRLAHATVFEEEVARARAEVV